MRTLRARVLGLLALLGILALVVGVPLLLVAIGANPIPNSLPTWDGIRSAITSPDDGTALLVALRVIAWAAWIFIAGSVLLEIVYALRGLSAPKLPGLSLPQGMARGLVTAAALLFVSIPTSGVATAAALPVVAAAQAAVTAPTSPAPTAATNTPSSSITIPQAAAPQTAPTVTYTVRQGDTLWSIAQAKLGSGERYRDIADLNYHRTQTDGGRLDNTHWIRPGWTLELPAAAVNTARASDTAHQVTVKKGDTLWDIADQELGDGAKYPEIFAASTAIAQPGGRHLTDPDQIDVGWTLNVPRTDVAPPATPTAPVAPAPSSETPPAPQATPAPVAPDSPAVPATPRRLRAPSRAPPQHRSRPKPQSRSRKPFRCVRSAPVSVRSSPRESLRSWRGAAANSSAGDVPVSAFLCRPRPPRMWKQTCEPQPTPSPSRRSTPPCAHSRAPALSPRVRSLLFGRPV